MSSSIRENSSSCPFLRLRISASMERLCTMHRRLLYTAGAVPHSPYNISVYFQDTTSVYFETTDTIRPRAKNVHLVLPAHKNRLDNTRCHLFFLLDDGGKRRVCLGCERDVDSTPLPSLGEMVNTFFRSRRKTNTAAGTVCCTKTKHRSPHLHLSRLHAHTLTSTAPHSSRRSYACGAVYSLYRWRVSAHTGNRPPFTGV